MWNSFDSCRLKLELADCHAENGLPSDELRKQVSELTEKYKKISVSRAKAEAIAFMLRNAGLYLHVEDLFVTQTDHGNIMADFLAENCAGAEIKEISEALNKSKSAKVIRANMDFGHIAPDWQYVLEKGITGIIFDLETVSERYDGNSDKSTYYSERITVYRAMKDCFERFAQLADSYHTEKASFISDNLRHLAKNPPQTMAQAMQLILLFYRIQTDLDTVIVRSLGGLDRLLYPFYKSDLENGRYTREQLGEITKYFLWKISCMKVIANLPFYICGMDENGKDATNEFTGFLLEQYRELDIYDPKIHVMYHDGMDPKILRLILEMVREGKNSFVFMNTGMASRALERIGISAEDAKRVVPYGCYETAAEGTEVPCTCAGMINLAKVVELVAGSEKTFDTYESFYYEVMDVLRHHVKVCMETISAYERHYKDICPSLIMSPTYRSSRESATDIYSGGAKYNNTSVVCSGMATLVDSLIAVKKVVFEEKLRTFGELREILNNNWETDEKLRLLIKAKYPKYGNNIQEADDIAVDIYNALADWINGAENGRGGVFRCGMFSVDWRLWMGEETGATPDGRLAGEPLSKNLAATVGQDKNGVTAYLNSLLKLDAEKCPDGYVADVILHCTAVKGEEGMAAFTGLLKTFMKKGGFSVHFNILSPETLIKARQEPDKYRNLQIRLCGWNVRFVDLDKEQQDEFIRQSANVM